MGAEEGLEEQSAWYRHAQAYRRRLWVEERGMTASAERVHVVRQASRSSLPIFLVREGVVVRRVALPGEEEEGP